MLAGGVGGARFVRGVREEVRRRWPVRDEGQEGAGERDGGEASVTVIVNTGDDLWLAGVRLMPDFDSLLYSLAGVNDTERGWGRAGETERVAAELREWGVGWPWFTLGDLDLGTHLARTAWLREGATPSQVAERLQGRWPLGVRLIPATDTEVDTHVLVADPDAPGGEREMHFQEWWTRYRASLPAIEFRQRNIDAARPAPGVVEAITGADLVLFAPSNPVVSIGTILSVPGIREAITDDARAGHRRLADHRRQGRARHGRRVPSRHRRRDERRCGRASLRRPVGRRPARRLARRRDGCPGAGAARAGSARRAASVPLWMRDLDTSAALAGAAIDLGGDAQAPQPIRRPLMRRPSS